MRLAKDEKRGLFDFELQAILLKITNVNCEDKEEYKEEAKYHLLFHEIKYQKLRADLRKKYFMRFSDLLKRLFIRENRIK